MTSEGSSQSASSSKQPSARPYDFFKRLIDMLISALLLILTAPLLAIVAVFVAIRLGRPVLFRQSRPGKDAVCFTLLKFRTMLDVREDLGLVTNKQRLTPFGRKLRATSLDELPSLWNVLRGDMSLVGPRPLRVDYLSRYSPRQARRHEIRPGITGLAQVNGRNALDWNSRFELDVEYVDRRSIALDLKILAATLIKVLHRDGIEGDKTAAMSAFMGADNTGLDEVELNSEWLETRVSWLRDERVNRGISLSFEPSLQGMIEWWKSANANVTRRDWVYTTSSGEPVAMCGLSGIGTPDVTLYLYVNPELQGQGYGNRALQKLIRRAQSFGSSRLHLETKRDNSAALALYRKFSFTEETLKEPNPNKVGMMLDLRDPHAGQRMSTR